MRLLKEILELLPVGILLCKGQQINLMNQQFIKLMAHEKGESNEQIYQSFQTLIEQFTTQTEFQIECEGKYLLVMKQHFNEENIIYVITDLTVARKLQSTQLEENFKDQLMRLFMHEFKTPLNWLNGALSSIVPTDTTKELLQMSKHAVDLLNLYICDISFYNNHNRKDSASVETISQAFSISVAINECLQFTSSEMSVNNIKCTIFLSEQIKPLMAGNPMRYKQILNNILCNSIKSCKINQGKIDIKVELEDDKITTIISDNGTLLSDKEIELLMNPVSKITNYNLEVRFGIGMILCRDMCRRCEGDLSISIENNQNNYNFWMPYIVNSIHPSIIIDKDTDEIPFELSERSLQSNSAEKNESTRENKITKIVLAVDDTSFNNIVMQNMLKLLKIECVTRANGMEAYEYFLSHDREKIGLILMDINMPVLDGIEVQILLGNQND